MADSDQSLVVERGADIPVPSPGAAVQKDQSRPQSDTGGIDVEARLRDIARYREKMAPLEAEAEAAAKQKIPAPQLQDIKPAPQNNVGQDAIAWLGFATALGGMAGALTKNHSMNAMAAFSGALDGLQQGNQQKFENDYKTWEANAKAAQLNNQKELDNYKLALTRQDLDARQRANLAEIYAHEARNGWLVEAFKHAAQTGDLAFATAAFDAATKLNDDFGNTIGKITLAREQRQQKLADEKAIEDYRAANREKLARTRLSGGMGMEGAEDEAERIASYRQQPYSPAQTARNPRAAAIMAIVAKDHPDYDPRQFQAGQRAETAMAAGSLGQRVVALNTAVNHLDYLDELGEALDSGQTQRINAVVRRAQVELGATLPNTFEGIKQIVLNEVVNAIVPSGGAVSDREEAQKQITLATTKEQLHDMVKKYKGLLSGRLEPLRQQYQAATHGVNFDKYITPRAKEALEGNQAPARPATNGAAPVQVKSPEEARKLPSGTQFIIPDGSGRIGTVP